MKATIQNNTVVAIEGTPAEIAEFMELTTHRVTVEARTVNINDMIALQEQVEKAFTGVGPVSYPKEAAPVEEWDEPAPAPEPVYVSPQTLRKKGSPEHG